MHTRRSRAREVALQLLHQQDQNPNPLSESGLRSFAHERLQDDPDLVEYCLTRFQGTHDHRREIDAKITAVAENWRLSRMLVVDRCVLRLATFELLYDPASEPVAVILNEAIELARRYGSKDSPKFVNGILDRVARARTSATAASSDVSVAPPVDTEPPTPSTPSI